ncbi:DoxX family protein [Bradyrhizobium sp. AZCC 1693]|uniref:DoxX family protein n=1 Tax=Bradyrhizobium sp. AZCC 1693 TaxID=3117029 RepID=UPI002FF1BF82
MLLRHDENGRTFGGIQLARVAAIGLVLYTVVVTIAFHGFWGLEGAARFARYIHFMKNVGLAGAFIIIAGVGAGACSLDALLGKRRQANAGLAKKARRRQPFGFAALRALFASSISGSSDFRLS